LLGLAFLQTLADQVLNTFESVLVLLGEVDFRSSEEFFTEDYFGFIWKLVGCLIGMLIIGNCLIFVLEKMAILVFDFSHYLLSKSICTNAPHSFMALLSSFWLP